MGRFSSFLLRIGFFTAYHANTASILHPAVCKLGTPEPEYLKVKDYANGGQSCITPCLPEMPGLARAYSSPCFTPNAKSNYGVELRDAKLMLGIAPYGFGKLWFHRKLTNGFRFDESSGLVYPISQFLSWLEVRRSFFPDFHLFAGFGIAGESRRVYVYREATEPPDFDPIS